MNSAQSSEATKARASLKIDFFWRTYWVCSRIAILWKILIMFLQGQLSWQDAACAKRIEILHLPMTNNKEFIKLKVVRDGARRRSKSKSKETNCHQRFTKASNGSNLDFNPTYEDSSSAAEYAGQRTTPVQAACLLWMHNRTPCTQHSLSMAADLSPVKQNLGL